MNRTGSPTANLKELHAKDQVLKDELAILTKKRKGPERWKTEDVAPRVSVKGIKRKNGQWHSVLLKRQNGDWKVALDALCKWRSATLSKSIPADSGEGWKTKVQWLLLAYTIIKLLGLERKTFQQCSQILVNLRFLLWMWASQPQTHKTLLCSLSILRPWPFLIFSETTKDLYLWSGAAG